MIATMMIIRENSNGCLGNVGIKSDFYALAFPHNNMKRISSNIFSPFSVKPVENRKSSGYSGIYKNNFPQTYKSKKSSKHSLSSLCFYNTNIIVFKTVSFLLRLYLR